MADIFFLIVPGIIAFFATENERAGKLWVPEFSMRTFATAGHQMKSGALQIGNELADFARHTRETARGSPPMPERFQTLPAAGHSAARAPFKRLALFRPQNTFKRMALMNLDVAEEALSLSSAERAGLAKLLIQSLEDDPRTDAEIKDDLTQRLKDLVSGQDSGLTFAEVFAGSYIRERAARGSREKFDRVLDKVPDVEPEQEDRLSPKNAA